MKTSNKLYIGLGIGTLVGGSVLAYHLLQRKNFNDNQSNINISNSNIKIEDEEFQLSVESPSMKIEEPQNIFSTLSTLQVDNISEAEASLLNQALQKFRGDDQVKIIDLINRAAAFSRNMKVLRDKDCLASLQKILHEATLSNSTLKTQSKLSTVNALVNLACDIENQKLLMTSIVDLPMVMQDIEDSELGVACLKTLSNLSLTSVCHEEISRLIPYLYTLLEEEDDADVLKQVVSILLNLSTEKSSIPALLCYKAPENIIELISGTTHFTKDNGLLEKWIRFLKNLFHEMKVSNFNSEESLHLEGGAGKGESMLSQLQELRLQMKAKVFLLTLNCDKEELSTQAKAFYDYLQPAAF